MTPEAYLLALATATGIIGATVAFTVVDLIREAVLRRRFSRWVGRQSIDFAFQMSGAGGCPAIIVFSGGRGFAVYFTDRPTEAQFRAITKLRDARFRCVASTDFNYLKKDFLQWQ